MALDLAALPDDVDALRAIVAAQAAELAAKDSLIDALRLQLAIACDPPAGCQRS